MGCTPRHATHGEPDESELIAIRTLLDGVPARKQADRPFRAVQRGASKERSELTAIPCY